MTAWLCSFAWLAALFCGPGPSTSFTGYVEGESLLIAPQASARIESLLVNRGQTVSAGTPIARLVTDDARFLLQTAEAHWAESKARLENLTTGKRAEEIAVLDAARSAARTELKLAGLDLDRAQDLFRRGMLSQAALDTAQTRQEVARSRVEEIDANLKVAGIAARLQEIEAARFVMAARQAEFDRARWMLAEHTVIAPEHGVIEDILRHGGEQAGPAAPIVRLLPTSRRKVRVFVPQAQIAILQPGTRLVIACDGCPDGLRATVDFIASEPEYTPPVLYSVAHRERLVILVEARLEGAAATLKPGQIVDVTRQMSDVAGATDAAHVFQARPNLPDDGNAHAMVSRPSRSP